MGSMMRGGQTASRQAHILENAGPNPAPAIIMIAALLLVSGCFAGDLRADSDDVQLRRLKVTAEVSASALKAIVPKPSPVERNEHGDPVREPDLVVIDTRRMSPEDVQALVVSMANAFSKIKHNTARAMAWAKADVIGSGTVEPDKQLELGSDEEHARNAQHLAKESQRAYNLAWWRELVKLYRGVMQFYESSRFWLKWGGLVLAIGFAVFSVVEWLGKRRERREKEDEKLRVSEAVEALDEIKHSGNGNKELVVKATAGKAYLKRGFERARVEGGT